MVLSKVLFRTLIGLVAAAVEGMRQYLAGAEFVDLGQYAAIAGVVAAAAVSGLGILTKKYLTDK
jgi:hypothetical protein